MHKKLSKSCPKHSVPCTQSGKFGALMLIVMFRLPKVPTPPHEWLGQVPVEYYNFVELEDPGLKH